MIFHFTYYHDFFFFYDDQDCDKVVDVKNEDIEIWYRSLVSGTASGIASSFAVGEPFGIFFCKL